MFIVGFITVYLWRGFNVEIISMFVYKTVIYKLYIGFIIGVIVSKIIERKFSKFNWSKGENVKNVKNTSIIITVIVILLLSIVSNVSNNKTSSGDSGKDGLIPSILESGDELSPLQMILNYEILLGISILFHMCLLILI